MIVSAQEMTFTYAGADYPALNGISLEIEEGSFTLICGASGSGKSTFLRLLCGSLAPRGKLSGKAQVNVPQSEVAFVQQNPEASVVTDRVYSELAFGLESAGIPPKQMRRRVAECAEYFGLAPLFEKDTAALSGGEKQLVSLAAAAAQRPRLLLLDEPTSQLDPISAREFIETARRFCRDFGITVLIAEHRLEELVPVCDRIIIMDKGSVTADCTPGELLLKSDHRMFPAMPAAYRAAVMGGKTAEIPLTINEGRRDPAVREYLKNNVPAISPRTPSGKLVLSAKNICAGYGKQLPDALKRASLELYGGEIYALLGGNGSGKSTFLKVLGGIMKPIFGSVKRAKGLKTAYLPQEPCALFSEETAKAELIQRGIADPVAAAERFGLRCELLERHPLDLSGGERQKLALAVLMAGEPDVLLLDEPTKGLDACAKNELSRLLRQQTERGVSVLLVTHDTEFAALCADRCGLLFNGEVLSEGTAAEFFSGNYFYTTPMARLSEGIAEGWF